MIFIANIQMQKKFLLKMDNASGGIAGIVKLPFFFWS